MTTGVLEIEGNGLLIMLDKTGDSRMQWDRDNPEEVTKAEARFKELKGKGYLQKARSSTNLIPVLSASSCTLRCKEASHVGSTC
jgi:hypothetical protein